MNRYEIVFSMCGGPQLTCEKAAKTEFAAKQQLWSQLGSSSRVVIHKIERVCK